MRGFLQWAQKQRGNAVSVLQQCCWGGWPDQHTPWAPSHRWPPEPQPRREATALPWHELWVPIGSSFQTMSFAFLYICIYMFMLVRMYIYIFRYNPCQQFPALTLWRGTENISSSFRNVFDINPKVSHFVIFFLKCLVAELLLSQIFELLLK